MFLQQLFIRVGYSGPWHEAFEEGFDANLVRSTQPCGSSSSPSTRLICEIQASKRRAVRRLLFYKADRVIWSTGPVRGSESPE